MAFKSKEEAKAFFDNKVAKQINILMYSLGERSNLDGAKLKDLKSASFDPSEFFDKRTTIYYIPTNKGHVAFLRVLGSVETVSVFERDEKGYSKLTSSLNQQAVNLAIAKELEKLQQTKPKGTSR